MSHFHKKMEKRKPTVNLSIFTVLTESLSMDKPTKSSRNFENGGVGLGIVAAMTDAGIQESAKLANPALSPRSSPIPIVSLAKPAANFKRGGVGFVSLERYGDPAVDESDESYTCVISHVGNNVIKKRIYYGDDIGGLCDDKISVFNVNPGLFYTSSSPMMITMISGGENRKEFCSKDFLSSCFLCNKLLHGLDIFMYRGEKAFCSAECRDKQILSEDYKEKGGYEARKAHDCSMSPCPSPQVFFAGVAAA